MAADPRLDLRGYRREQHQADRHRHECQDRFRRREAEDAQLGISLFIGGVEALAR
jgi:hypothetical protein